MTIVNNLDERKKKILASVVEGYILSAEPVGSKTIAEKYNLDFSPATIRNDMKLLEESGFLEQPHISSGRIPSSKGYRYYVDNLMQSKKLSLVEMNYIDNSLNGYGDTSELLKQAADTVSKIINRPTIISLKNEDILKSIKILKVSEKILLIVLLSENGEVKDVIAKLTDTIDDSKVSELSKLLNHNLQGTPIEKLYTVLSNIIVKELKHFSSVLEKICEGLKQDLNNNDTVVKNNLPQMLDLPEFTDSTKLKNFVNMLSTKEIVDMAVEKIVSKDLGVVIGSETEELMLKDYSIVSLNIEDDNNSSIGKLSVVSPKRLDYSKTISTLKYVNDKVKDIFSRNKDLEKNKDTKDKKKKSSSKLKIK